VGYVDGIPIMHYDSDTERAQPRADWMGANLDQQYWDSVTSIEQNNQRVDRLNLETQ
ncbi:HA1F protein, partial [Chloroceryle aenea]|nr:HA1F protein [Chloroceryle aenea]